MPGAALFVYGTLLDDAQVEAVTGRRFPRRPARLEDYARIAPAGGYPYVVPCPGGVVDGVLLEDVDTASLRALDRFEDEGRLYVRRTVTVVADGESIACQTYVGASVRGENMPA